MEQKNSLSSKATKKCPYCGEDINIDATKCRYCGEWLAKDVVKPTSQKPETSTKSETTMADVVDGVSTGLGCFWALIQLGIPVVLLVFAYNSKPSLEEHQKEVVDDVVECTKEEVKNTASMFVPGLGDLASSLIDGSIKSESLKAMFFRYNHLELKESWFWNRGVLYNSAHPDGTTVSFGICDFVIPLVKWEDFKLTAD